jgi:polysaccharide deacetylase 2 family uncharacterized protein YibQ
MKFPNPFKGKGDSEDEEDEDFDEEEVEDGSEENAQEGDDDYDDELDFEDEDGPNAFSKFVDKLKSNPKILIVGGAGASVLIIGVVLAVFLLGEDGENSSPTNMNNIPRSKSSVSLDLDAATKGGKKMLTPPPTVGGKIPAKASKPAPEKLASKEKTASKAEQKSSGATPPPLPAASSPAKQARRPTAKAKSSTSGIQTASVEEASFTQIPEIKAEKPLSTVPDAALIEQTPQGQVPKIGADGRLPLKVYARPYNSSDARPRISLIVTGLGLSRAATSAAVRRLPGAVTLAFDPYGSNLADWAAAARDNGHETLILLPMESSSFPAHDPGPNAILSTVEQKENLRRLELVMSSMPGYVGLMNSMGSQFIQDGIRLKPILEAIKARGLMFLDSGQTRKSQAPKLSTQIGLPRAISNVIIDRKPSKAAINRQLTRLENIAHKQTVSIGILHPYPVSLEAVIAWIKTLDQKKLMLGPISSMADIQLIR